MRLVLPMLVAAVGLSGCASILSDSNYPVSIQSTPSGAAFRVLDEDGQAVSSGVTPLTVSLDASDGFFSKANYTVEFMQGGRKISRDLTPSVDGWYIGNILFGGILGLLIVDPATGAMYKLPESFNADLSGGGVSSLIEHGDATLTIAQLDEVPKDMRSKLVRID